MAMTTQFFQWLCECPVKDGSLEYKRYVILVYELLPPMAKQLMDPGRY